MKPNVIVRSSLPIAFAALAICATALRAQTQDRASPPSQPAPDWNQHAAADAKEDFTTVIFDGLKTWPYRRVLVPQSRDGPQGRLNYPDGFVSPTANSSTSPTTTTSIAAYSTEQSCRA